MCNCACVHRVYLNCIHMKIQQKIHTKVPQHIAAMHGIWPSGQRVGLGSRRLGNNARQKGTTIVLSITKNDQKGDNNTERLDKLY